MTQFCICATCKHSHGFPAAEEMLGTEYRHYQDLLDASCVFLPPVPVPHSQINSAGPRVTTAIRSVYPTVSPVGRCSQWEAA